MNLYSAIARKKKIQEEDEDEYSRDFFPGKVLSTPFGDDTPNGTPINFVDEDLYFPKRQGGQENAVKNDEVITPKVA